MNYRKLSRREWLAAIAAAAGTSAARAALTWLPPEPAHLANVNAAGDLAKRSALNFQRLEEPYYQPAEVLARSSRSTWPGDEEGRLLLGLTLEQQANHREARYLNALLAGYRRLANAGGYLGPLLDPNAINEQQLSGHGWLLRGYCEHYRQTRDSASLDAIGKIVQNLVLKTAGKHRVYPIDPAVRHHGGGIDGAIEMNIGSWRVSSDIGCDFILLDGAVHAWELLRTPELRAVIDEMIARYLQIDLKGIQAQTHASLTGIRALLRYHGLTGNSAVLHAAAARYALYRAEAMTENYENYNWFGRPEWTEPCAVIDSFMAAVMLWRYTGIPEYLADAHHIYYNGLCPGQRANGGFGPNTCSGAKDPFIGIHLLEAQFCCTMRGGEGLARAVEYLFFTSEEAVWVPFFHSGSAAIDFRGQPVHIRQETGYPHHGHVTLERADRPGSAPVPLRLLVPSWANGPQVARNGRPEPVRVRDGFLAIPAMGPRDRIEIRFDQPRCARGTQNRHSISGHKTIRSCPLLLTTAAQAAEQAERDYQPLLDMPLDCGEAGGCRRRLLFRV